MNNNCEFYIKYAFLYHKNFSFFFYCVSFTHFSHFWDRTNSDPKKGTYKWYVAQNMTGKGTIPPQMKEMDPLSHLVLLSTIFIIFPILFSLVKTNTDHCKYVFDSCSKCQKFKRFGHNLSLLCKVLIYFHVFVDVISDTFYLNFCQISTDN